MKTFIQFILESIHPMIDIDGEQKHRTNSEGRPLHHTDEGIKNFHKWFGNSSSTDQHGRPQVHYHGTGSDIEQFNDKPIWLSKTPELATGYAEHRGTANVMPVYAKTKKTFDSDTLPNSVSVNKFYSELNSQAKNPSITPELNKHRKTVIDSAQEEESGPHYNKKDFWHESNMMFGQKGKNALHDSLHTAGFDSIKHNEDGHDTIGLLHSSQVKSAIGNSGKFSSSSEKLHETVA